MPDSDVDHAAYRRRVRNNWVMLAAAVNAILSWHRKAYRYTLRMLELEYHFPMMHSILRAMEPVTDRAASTPHCRMSGQQAYPETPGECDHPRTSQRYTGNAHGRFRECQECGRRWKGRCMVNPISCEEVILYDQEQVTRPRPGAQLPRTGHKAKTKGKASDPSQEPPSSAGAPQTSTPVPPAPTGATDTTTFTAMDADSGWSEWESEL